MANARGQGRQLGLRFRRRRRRQAHRRDQDQGGPRAREGRVRSTERRGGARAPGRGAPEDTGRAGSGALPAQDRHRRHGSRVRTRHRAVLQLSAVDVRHVLHPLPPEHAHDYDRARRQVLRAVLGREEQHGIPADVGGGVRHGFHDFREHRAGRRRGGRLAEILQPGPRLGAVADQDGFPLRRRRRGPSRLRAVPRHVRVLQPAAETDRAGGGRGLDRDHRLQRHDQGSARGRD
mmetsp:Transcript_5102/g.19199  ORF Transcript_5102/g.19199 Transcript_5102/m.19199 type:complete len:234 (+) Transcript_5102:242-943(+)